MRTNSFYISMVTLVLSCQSTVQEQDHNKPNIIFIMLDEWGYFESSMMGHPILKTPNIDKLASEGIRFTQFLAGANVCAPTRSVLMTGQHTGHTTVRTNGGGQALRDDDFTLAEMLKEGGYTTGGFGKWGLGDVGTSGVPEKQGFDVFFGYYHQVHAHTYYPRYLIRNSKRIPLSGNTGDIHSGQTFSQYLIHQEGLKFIKDNRDRPFFAYLPWTPPHGHWHMPDDDPSWSKYKDVQWDAANQQGKHDAQIYAAMVEMVDRQIGEIIQLLKELDIYRHTVLFICGDNGGQAYFANESHLHGFFAPNLNPKTGERFRGGKRNFYEGGLRIPFIAHWSGRIRAGQISDHLGYFPDLMPTFAEIAGLPQPITTDGLSLVPTLRSASEMPSTQKEHKYLYWEDEKSIAIRMQNWKAIRPSQESNFELYDLSNDIQELDNVAEKFPEILAQMRTFADDAHSTPSYGTVLDSTVRFSGHKAD